MGRKAVITTSRPARSPDSGITSTGNWAHSSIPPIFMWLFMTPKLRPTGFRTVWTNATKTASSHPSSFAAV